MDKMQPTFCGKSKEVHGVYVCTYELMPCERVKRCPLEDERFKELAELFHRAENVELVEHKMRRK